MKIHLCNIPATTPPTPPTIEARKLNTCNNGIFKLASAKDDGARWIVFHDAYTNKNTIMYLCDENFIPAEIGINDLSAMIRTDEILCVGLKSK